MTLQQAILLTLLQLPGPWQDPASAEPPEGRRERLSTIAEAMSVVAAEGAPGWRWSGRELAAALIATSYAEGQRLHPDVHSGKRSGDCRPGKPCRAACLMQVWQQRTISRAEWQASMGTDLEATTMCMRLGARVLGQSARCVWRDRDLDAYQASRLFTAYATGRTCRPIKLARDRGWHWAKLDRRLDGLTKVEAVSLLN